jgi:hypothetical protein
MRMFGEKIGARYSKWSQFFYGYFVSKKGSASRGEMRQWAEGTVTVR